jgi:uncharacterized membrane-anchored protein
MRTLSEVTAEMVQIVLAEGASDNVDRAALALIRAGYRPSLIAALLDEAMADAREFMAPALAHNIIPIHGARSHA